MAIVLSKKSRKSAPISLGLAEIPNLKAKNLRNFQFFRSLLD